MPLGQRPASQEDSRDWADVLDIMPRRLTSTLVLVCLCAVLILLGRRGAGCPCAESTVTRGRGDGSSCFDGLHKQITMLSRWIGCRPLRDEGTRTSDSSRDSWNILYHLGGNGPWIPKVDGVIKGGVAPPAGCKVEQIHMVRLHYGDQSNYVFSHLHPNRVRGRCNVPIRSLLMLRWRTDVAACRKVPYHQGWCSYVSSRPGTEQLELTRRLAGMLALLDRMKKSKSKMKGDLAFVNDWEFFIKSLY